MTEPWQLDATAQSELIRSRKVLPTELADIAIRRIEDLDGHINSLVTSPMGV